MDPIDRVVREKRLSRMEKMRADRKELCVVWQEKTMCVCYTVYPSDASECLGLRVLWSRGYRGKKATESGMVEDHGLAPECSEPSVIGSECWKP